jgi:hypothetical protein
MCWFRRSGNVPLGERLLDVLADARARLIRHSCADDSSCIRVYGRPAEDPEDQLPRHVFRPAALGNWRV